MGETRDGKRPGGMRKMSLGSSDSSLPYVSPHHIPLFLPGSVGVGLECLGSPVTGEAEDKCAQVSLDGHGPPYLENAPDTGTVYISKIC